MKTKLTVNHDRLTLSVTDTVGKRMNLTISRRGKTASGTADGEALRAVFGAFISFLRRGGKRSYGELMADLERAATAATDFSEFVAAVS